MLPIHYEQAVYGSFPFWDRGYALLSRSPGCRPEWLSEFQEACQRFGEPTRGATGAGALFALRLASGPWAIVGVCPQGADDRGRPGALAFHGLFVSPREFRKARFHPFALADALRCDWGPETPTLTAGTITIEPEPEPELIAEDEDNVGRIVEALSGRGRRVALESSEPIGDLARRVWLRLDPGRRQQLSLATLAFGNANRFDLVALPRLSGEGLDASYVTPDTLQAAMESPARRRTAWTGRRLGYLAAGLACVLILVLLGLRGGEGGDAKTDRAADPATIGSDESRAIADTSCPARAAFRDAPSLSDQEGRIAEALSGLADRFGVAGGPEDPAALMPYLAERLRYRGPWLSAADLARLRAERSSDPDAARALEWHEHMRRFALDRPLPPDFALGPLSWQLEALAWSFRLPTDPRRSPAEIPDALADALAVGRPPRPSPLASRYPALEDYAEFLKHLPRR